MTDTTLVDRLAALPNLATIPRQELEWLAAHGRFEVHEPGAVIGPKNEPLQRLWIVVSGYIAIRVDRGTGARRVMEWGAGEVTGLLPYSRMIGPPGDNYVEKRTELLTIYKNHFPEMIHRCPVFTTCTVHLMLDRARNFKTSDLQDEKMISLGKLAAGLAHELNNPASAIVRGAKLMQESLSEADAASRTLGTFRVSGELFDILVQLRAACLAKSVSTDLSPLQRADREDEIADWLLDHHVDPSHATPLADSAITMDMLETLASKTSSELLDAALHWIATGSVTHWLAIDIEDAATRIHELIAAVKRFTYMDQQAGPESVEVEPGLRDTIRVLASKAKAKNATLTLEAETDLPPVCAIGGELNQVWMNLIDNALDAIPQSGHIEINVYTELDRVVVCVLDDGPGIPEDLIGRIFDPFVTTKPPGQGTGLGLDIARRIVSRYKGDLAVESRPGRTEFRVSLLTDTPERAEDDG